MCLAGDEGGLPIGVQVIGKHFDEGTMLRVAQAVEWAEEALRCSHVNVVGEDIREGFPEGKLLLLRRLADTFGYAEGSGLIGIVRFCGCGCACFLSAAS